MMSGERHGRLVFLESLGLDHENQSIGRFLCDCGRALRETAGEGSIRKHVQLRLFMVGG